jgi:hypothetical protein
VDASNPFGPKASNLDLVEAPAASTSEEESTGAPMTVTALTAPAADAEETPPPATEPFSPVVIQAEAGTITLVAVPTRTRP